MARYHVTAFYCFASLSEDEVARVETALSDLAEAEKDLGGLVILAPEGINGTIAGSEGTVSKLKEVVRSFEPFHEILFKDSFCRLAPFPRFKTKRREEIVTLHRTDLVPTERSNNHLSPEEWNEMMAQDDVVVIDTRNAYETRLGMFEGAVDPNIDTFSEFGEFVQQSGWQRDQKVLMYCTGGIRCEKAILEMQQLGFENVYQLEGGILRYLKEFPDGKFNGECFVFDHRVAVDRSLEASERFRLCPHCGDPGDQRITCVRCSRGVVICESCRKRAERNTCSKDCSHHFLRQQSLAESSSSSSE